MTAVGKIDELMQLDVLTLEEESSISTVRDIVSAIREHGVAIESRSIKHLLAAAGAVEENTDETKESGRYFLIGSRFSVRVDMSPGGWIEMRFEH
jgi:hypothetical protein